MSEETPSLDIVIRTRADLEGAQSAEAQLDRDINKARELGQEYESQEHHAQQARAERSAETPGRHEPEGIEHTTEPPLRPIGPEAGASPEVPGQLPRSEVSPAPGGEINAPSSSVPPADLPSPEAQAQTPSVSQQDGPESPEPAASEAALPSLDVRGFEAQAGAMEAAGEKLRAVLEQNGQTTAALLGRTVELVEQQNAQLADLGRRLDQLAGQIKSLKNP